MVHNSILVNNSLEETEQILKEIIPQINGKIKSISDEEYLIEWTYLYGLQTIWCVTKLIPNKKEIEIFTTSDSDDIYKTGAEKALNKLYNSLSESTILKTQKTEKKHEHSPIIKSSNKTNFKPFIIAGIIILLVASYFNSKNSTQSNIRTTKYGYYAAYDEKSLEKAIRYVTQKDNEAITKLIYQGDIFELQGAKEVHLIDQTFSGIVKIRIRGTTEEIWTIREALNK